MAVNVVLLLVLWMSLPVTRGAQIIHSTYLKPNLMLHEDLIDSKIQQLEFIAKSNFAIYRKRIKEKLIETLIADKPVDKKLEVLESDNEKIVELKEDFKVISDEDIIDSPKSKEKRKHRRLKKKAVEDELKFSDYAHCLPAIGKEGKKEKLGK
ncbi:hypothetical protein HDV04_000829 [Boothiomyces sp. JEL0838]|nr:hypothetical protein HDV04_000829 [Boothiomyces sp. JEL0838]